MNHIQRLTSDNLDYASRILAAQDEIREFRAFLLSAKFQGTDTDGDRKDWIATADVLRRLETLQAITNGTN